MKILYIITQGEQGGAQTNVLDCANYFADKNEATVATGEQKNEKDKWLHDNLSEKVEKKIFLNLQREINAVKAIKAGIEIYKYIKKEKPQIVHLHSTMAGMIGSIAAKMCEVRVYYTVHGFVFREPGSIFKKIFYIFCELFASLFIDKYIIISQEDVKLGKKYFILRGENNNANFKLIYNGIDQVSQSVLDKQVAKDYLQKGINKNFQNTNILNKKIIGTISNLYKTKGIEYTVQAVYLLKERYVKEDKEIDFIYIVTGEGSERQYLEDIIKEKKLENEFILYGSLTDARNYLRAFDIFVLSSVKEGLPYCLLEAAREELPIVASRVGGIVEMSESIDIETFESTHSQQIADKLYEILNHADQEKYKTKLHEKFLKTNMLISVEDFYNLK